jgi:replication factor C large subunit
MTAIKWTEKYRPKSLKEVLGNGKAVSDLEAWARAWERGVPEKRAVVLYGPAGVGKTSAALALAEELGWDQIEMNASDSRTAAAIQKVAGAASKMMTSPAKRGSWSWTRRTTSTALRTGAALRRCLSSCVRPTSR